MSLDWEAELFDDLSGCWVEAELPDGGLLSVQHHSGYNTYNVSLLEAHAEYATVNTLFQGSVTEAKTEAEEIYQAYIIQTYGVDSWTL